MAQPYYWNIPIYASSMADLGRQESEWARTNLNTAADNIARENAASRYANDLAAQRDMRDQQAAEVAYRWGVAAREHQDQLKQQELDRKLHERQFTTLSAAEAANRDYRNAALQASKDAAAAETLARVGGDVRAAAKELASVGHYKSPEDVKKEWLPMLTDADRQIMSEMFKISAVRDAEKAALRKEVDRITRPERIRATVMRKLSEQSPEDKAVPNNTESLQRLVATFNDEQLDPAPPRSVAAAEAMLKSNPPKALAIAPVQIEALNRWPTISGTSTTNTVPAGQGYFGTPQAPAKPNATATASPVPAATAGAPASTVEPNPPPEKPKEPESAPAPVYKFGDPIARTPETFPTTESSWWNPFSWKGKELRESERQWSESQQRAANPYGPPMIVAERNQLEEELRMRLQQLEIAQRSGGAFADPRVLRKLLTTEQARIEQIRARMAEIDAQLAQPQAPAIPTAAPASTNAVTAKKVAFVYDDNGNLIPNK